MQWSTDWILGTSDLTSDLCYSLSQGLRFETISSSIKSMNDDVKKLQKILTHVPKNPQTLGAGEPVLRC